MYLLRDLHEFQVTFYNILIIHALPIVFNVKFKLQLIGQY